MSKTDTYDRRDLPFFNMDSNLRRIECYRPHNTKRICELQNL